MGLFYTYGTENKVLKQPLRTTFERRNITRKMSQVDCAYIEYTRIRTQSFSYVGMDLDTAMTCVNDMTKLYQRTWFTWVWDNSNLIWRKQTTAEMLSGERLCESVADVGLVRVGNGQMWNVEVNVREEITIPYRPIISTNRDIIPTGWTQFESTPEMKTDAFKGDISGTDFGYDEEH